MPPRPSHHDPLPLADLEKLFRGGCDGKPDHRIGGPTGIGKTELSLKLARAVNGEIISGDSMQIYHHMDIGSAKIKPEEMQGSSIISLILDPRLPFSVAEYKPWP